VTELSPSAHPVWTGGRPAPESLRPLVSIFARDLPELTERLTIRLRREIPHYAEMPIDDLRAQSQAQLRYVLDQLSGVYVAPDDGPAAYGRMRSEQRVPLEVVLHAYRVAWAELWAGLLAAGKNGGPSNEDLLSASTEFFWMADEYAGRMLTAYRERATELLIREESERSATLEGVFSGYLHGSEALWEAAALVNLPYEGLFVVVAAAAPIAGREVLSGIREALERAHLSSAWRLAPDVEVGIVSLRVKNTIGALLDELRSRPGIRAGISAPYTRLAGTPHAFHLARLVLGTLQEGVGAIKQFAESPVGALLAAAPDTANELRKLVFGSMIDLPQEDLDTLMLTLSTWYDAGGSINDAAKQLYVHPNTIRYRLRRVQTQTGRSLDDPRDVADIRAALIAHDMIPHTTPP
jgi:PucR C-terminal helix-turn-helix domain/GGDEF-like domain